jgi:N-sulfoglucosamine sulfohydrolase
MNDEESVPQRNEPISFMLNDPSTFIRNLGILVFVIHFATTLVLAQDKPNFLWITCEDISPYLGSYGCKEALTPNLDKLAEKGIRFTNAYANAPVCAVARSTLLTGMYAPTIGTHQMRSHVNLPDIIPAYPKLFREHGYYCTNNAKEDYNSSFIKNPELWDESSVSAHYKNRKQGQPFFAVFNFTDCHESRINSAYINRFVKEGRIPEKPRIHPEDIELPPYHPDLPEIREDWARLHDLITMMDHWAGNLIDELAAEGLAEDTIIFFYSDHGGTLSRAKRYIYNVGTQVPFIAYFPEKWKHLAPFEPGKTSEALVSFIDFPKTVLSLAGIEPPELMQGRIFLGENKEPEPRTVLFSRDRMNERYDFSRAVTDGHYYFIRNYYHYRPRGRDIRYGFNVQRNWRAWEDHFEAGQCNEAQSSFFVKKPVIELFDTIKDPWHVKNLASDPEYKAIVERFEHDLDHWMIKIRDVALIPEPMYYELVGPGKEFGSIYEFCVSNERFPVGRILEVANQCMWGCVENQGTYIEFMRDQNPFIRFWGAYALFLCADETSEAGDALKYMIQNDIYAANRVMAAQALALCGQPDLAFDALYEEAMETSLPYVFLQALAGFQYGKLDERLCLEDWKKFRSRSFDDEAMMDKTSIGFAYDLIDDAISIFPEIRKVY